MKTLSVLYNSKKELIMWRNKERVAFVFSDYYIRHNTFLSNRRTLVQVLLPPHTNDLDVSYRFGCVTHYFLLRSNRFHLQSESYYLYRGLVDYFKESLATSKLAWTI